MRVRRLPTNLLFVVAALGAFAIPRAAAGQRPTPPSRMSVIDSSGGKRPGVAQALAIIPGAGHLYAGETRRAGMVLGGVLGVLIVGSSISDNAVECPGEEYSDEYCTSPTIDALTYAAAAGVLGWSIVDAGRAARRTNARQVRRAALRVDMRPARGGRSTLRVGLVVATR